MDITPQTSKPSPTSLSKLQLERKITDCGYQPANMQFCRNTQSDVITGHISFVQLASGPMIHCTDAFEVEDGASSSHIEDMISFNILLEGKVNYALNQHQYHFDATECPTMFANIIDGSQVFTRHFSKGQHVRKISISIHRKWLMERCMSEIDRQTTATIFAESCTVHHWPCPNQLITRAEKIIALNSQENLTNQLMIEALTLELISHCYPLLLSLERHAQPARVHLTHAQRTTHDKEYESSLAQLLHQQLTLKQIEKQLGASISTLQRYFKTHHQCTVFEYMRNQRLELARRAILLEQKTIGEAAYLAGYNHVSNFVTAFKKYFLMTPSELKRNHAFPNPSSNKA
ncbi:helix-turn-helix domain-containing protein [Echinimonas agarilytica]|uniref:AraC family transcriptional regulator n=1 Tax=Echinimonas agarilytica TaxID=1215918 RepID=A0AA42B7A7_9GAMM|nr:AraC family transcriptional regulator [Echinimonas agarilytica]MCM2679406.1 AraC family transcriptional regulator [Echinimonas agarilytica]